jgi:excisionase family DNA binding protein
VADLRTIPLNTNLSDQFFDSMADAIARRIESKLALKRRLLSLEQAAEYLGLSEDAVRDLVSEGRLRPVRPTRKLQFDICDLDEFIAELKRNSA